MDSSSLHPGELEFAHYLRGTLARDHAVAFFAHSVFCRQCRQRLESLLANIGPLPAPRGLRRTDESP
jgi:anti-sigma factor ChrR (cupin superfamily)